MQPECLDISLEVSDALASGQPVIALESTILSHGIPWPENVKTAYEVENIIRQAGAVPATTAILNGRLKAGLSAADIDYIGSHWQGMHKASRKDLPWLIAQKGDGTTTVASTMMIAAMVGIRVFATGGIGGVHREAQKTFDISADLQELARTPVAVVCSGPKIILDLGLTLEYLETLGVTVVGYGTDRLPGFYVRETQFKVDCRVDTPGEAASILCSRWSLGLDGGILVTNPIDEALALPSEEVEAILEQAFQTMASAGVTGNARTPWLLKRLHEATEGRSLATNIELLKSNVCLATDIALALNRYSKR